MGRLPGRLALSCSAIAALLLLGACGKPSSARPAADLGTTPSAPVSPSAAPSPAPSNVADGDALAAYRGFLSAYVDAARTSDPGAATLRQYAQGAALTTVTSMLFGNQRDQKVVRGELGTNPMVVQSRPVAEPTEVLIRDCLDDSHWLEYRASGELWDDKPGGRRQMQATVTKSDTGWKVAAYSMGAYGGC
jgi:hypothetical protein